MKEKDNLPRIKTYLLQEKGKIFLSSSFLAKVFYTCSRSSSKEWSGVLLYDFSGDIQDPTSVEIKCRDFYLLDLGSTAFTEFNHVDKEYIKFLTQNGLLGAWRGLIHSHHNMPTFFSNEDIDEMERNTATQGFYVSLIVNNQGNFTARASYIAEIETEGLEKLSYRFNNQTHHASRNVKTTEQRTITFELEPSYEWDGLLHIKDSIDVRSAVKQPQKSVFVSPPKSYPQFSFPGDDEMLELPMEETKEIRRQMLANLVYQDYECNFDLTAVLRMADTYVDEEDPKDTIKDILRMISYLEEEYLIDFTHPEYIEILNKHPQSKYAKMVKTTLEFYAKSKKKVK
jgi:proteasome lid subunit RPN8/RPN11